MQQQRREDADNAEHRRCNFKNAHRIEKPKIGPRARCERHSRTNSSNHKGPSRSSRKRKNICGPMPAEAHWHKIHVCKVTTDKGEPNNGRHGHRRGRLPTVACRTDRCEKFKCKTWTCYVKGFERHELTVTFWRRSHT